MVKTTVPTNSLLQKAKGKKNRKIKKKQRKQEQNARKQDQTQKIKVRSEEWGVVIIFRICYH